MVLDWLEKIAYTFVGMICVTVLGKIWEAFLGKIWDTIAGITWDAVLGKIGDYVAAPIQRQVNYMRCFDRNIKKLETHLQELEKTRQEVQLGVDDDLKKARDTGSNVKEWLEKVNEVTSEVDGIIQDKARVKEGCLNGWCPNLKLRYSLSREAVKKTEAVVELQAAGISYMETIPNRNFMGFESRRLNTEEIIEALKHDGIKLIGICGMGGIGKTTMVKEVAKREKEDNHFDEVAMAVVSQEPNLADVQACIADMLGLKLGDVSNPIVRADLLRKRLVQDHNKKVLVILDDIWKEFDLDDMGIPLGGPNKNLKMLYTSRTRDLWHDVRTKKEIALKLLSEDEAWKLFREKAGDSTDARDLQPIAKQIVHECKRLPLALVLIGSALSKTSGKNAIKDIWEGMLDRLTRVSSTPADNQLYSSLELSYEYLENTEAKRLFLLCCLFQEDEEICIEDLARYGYGLSLFDGINEMGRVRRQVLLIVDDLKSRNLLLDGDREGCVKVHDVVRDMGISIASRDKAALVSHGALSEWPRKDNYEHYTAISVISEKIKELPEGLTYPNLEFLMLRSSKLEKLPPDSFEGMGKLKVLDLKYFHGILTFQPLRNLTTLSLEGFVGVLDNVCAIGDLQNLEILSFRNSYYIKELPEEIGKLVNLRLLDLDATRSLKRIPRGVISRLVRLEELYICHSGFWNWEGKENANVRELESLSNLNTLEIEIFLDGKPIPSAPVFAELKMYKVFIGSQSRYFEWKRPAKRVLSVYRLTPSPSYPFISLLRSSDCLSLGGEGCNDLVRELLLRDGDHGVDGLQQLKQLKIYDCDTPECLANTMNLFPVLEWLELFSLSYLRQICCGPVPTGSFRELTKLCVRKCGLLENLFELPIGGCFTQLKILTIESCIMIKEVFRKQQREDVHDATKRIEFPKLETLDLKDLPSLGGFCGGIDQIDFPKLQRMDLKSLGKFKSLFHNNINLSSNSSQEDNFGFLSLFPQKVSLPKLEVLNIYNLENLETLGHDSLSEGSLSKLVQFSVGDCGKLLCVFPLQLVPMLQNLEIHGCHSLRYVFAPTMVKSVSQLHKLTIRECKMLSGILVEENGMGESTVDEVKFPQLERLELLDLPNLVSLFPDVNIALPKSTDRLHNPMQPQSLFNEKVVVPSLKYLILFGLENVGDLWCRELPSNSFSKLKKLEVRYCARLRNMFHPSLARGLVDLQELLIEDCSTLEAVVGKEEEVGGGHGSKIDKTLFPQLGKLNLGSLPKLKRFCNSTHPLELAKLSQMDILFCPSMDAFSSVPVCAPNLTLQGISWNGDLNNAIQLLQKAFAHALMSAFHTMDVPCLIVVKVVKSKYSNRDDPMARSMGKLRTLDDVTDNFKTWQVADTQCHMVATPNSIYGAHKVARLLYTHQYDDPTGYYDVLALGCNGIMTRWTSDGNRHYQSGMVVPQHKGIKVTIPQPWQTARGRMTNDVTGVNIEEAVPCIALSKNGSYVISACGGKISLFNRVTFKVMTTFMPPSPASTFLAFYPQDNNVIAIGMEDSTIRIYNVRVDEVTCILKGHQNRITGLAFSTNLNIMVSSGADAQLCIWSIYTWKKLKSVPIQLPTCKVCNGDTSVEFHSDLIRLLVSHETQLAIYDASKMDRMRQWVPQDVLLAPIFCAAYSCDSQLVYTSFCDGNIGVFDADSLTLQSRIAPSAFLSPTLLSGSQAMCLQFVLAAHPHEPNQFAIGLTDVFVKVMEPPESEGNRGSSPHVDNGMLNGWTASSSNTSNHTPDQKGEDMDVDEHSDSDSAEDVDEVLDKDVDEDELSDSDVDSDSVEDVDEVLDKDVDEDQDSDSDVDLEWDLDSVEDVDEVLDKEVDEDKLIMTRKRKRTATIGMHDGDGDFDDEEDLEKLQEEGKDNKELMMVTTQQ